jgi:hypothetical protein
MKLATSISTILAFAAPMLAGCMEAGGGGSVHNPPETVQSGVPIPIELELSAVNAHGSMNRRITAITCHYRPPGSPTFTDIPMIPKDIDSRHLVARCTIPPIMPAPSGVLVYCFTFDFDGHRNQHNTPENPIRVQLK